MRFFPQMNPVWIPLAIALAACGGAVSPEAPNDTTTSGTGSTGSGSSASTGSGSATGSSTGTSVGTSGTTGTSSSDTSGTSGTGTGSSSSTTGQSASAVTTSGVSGSVSTSGTIGSTTTGCSTPGMGGAGGASGASPDFPGPPLPADAGSSRPSDAAPVPPRQGIVLRLADFPPIPVSSGTGSTSSTTTGGGPDPNTQFIIVGNTTPSCSDLWGSGCGRWRLSIGIPPADFKPGVFPLAFGCSSVNAYYSVSGPDRGGGDCYGGGGTVTNGTLEILSVTTTTAMIRLTNTASFEFNADGVYQVNRCPIRP